ncbi:MFS transporter [Salinispora sp. H7-4]|uniref:MFS transporter n=1 Tax=Salinispora sp. H7-4 TaxID=2748321 RepID=UPI002814AA3F|nr:MFS transporter [Salinispora sp. H7-4]
MSSASPAHAPSYLTVLRLPQAARTFGAALVARFAYGIVFLALVLTVNHATGSYAVAGGVLAVFGLASSLLAPYRARLIDRHGVHRALLPMAAACAALLGLIAAVAWQPGAPGAAMWVLGTAAGACAPPLGPFMRTLWRDLVPDDEQLLQRAYSLDTVAEELLYVVGPLLAGALTALAEPALGVALSAVLLFGGTAALAGSPVAASFRGSAAPQPDTGGEQGTAPPRRDVRWWASLADPVLVTAGLGACLGAFNLLAVAFADRHGAAASVSWVSAALAVSSALGGLLYGAVRWRLSTHTRLPILAAFLGVFCVLSGQATGMVGLVALAGAVGFLMAPTLTTAYLIAGAVDSQARSTEAGTWVNTAFNTGNAAGSAGIGLLLSPLSLAWCFAVTGAVVLLPAAVTALSQTARKIRGSVRGEIPRTAARLNQVRERSP